MISLSGFDGANKAVHPRLLLATVGQDSINQDPTHADLRPWRQAQALVDRSFGVDTPATVISNAVRIYRYGRQELENKFFSVINPGSWKGFSQEVSIAVPPNAARFDEAIVTSDAGARYVGSFLPSSPDPQDAWTANADGLLCGRPLSIPGPAAAPTLTLMRNGDLTGSTVTEETRFYVYTYVNDLGWESEPSPISAQVDALPLSRIRVSGFTAAAAPLKITKFRIYRTQPGMSGEADFFFVDEIAASETEYFEEGMGQEPLTELCDTFGWAPFPAGGRNIITLWNGMMACSVGRTVRYCEPNKPYAWPLQYETMLDDEVICLAKFGQRLVAVTASGTKLIDGASPDSMQDTPGYVAIGTTAARSVVEFNKSAVVYASKSGLVMVDNGTPRIITDGILMQHQWQALGPETMVGCFYKGLYIASYIAPGSGNVRKAFAIDPLNPKGIYWMDAGFSTTYFDDMLGGMFYHVAGQLYQFDAAATFMTATWESKTFRTPKPVTYKTCELLAEAYPAVTFSFRALMDPTPGNPTPSEVTFSKTVTGQREFKLKPGFMASEWIFKIQTTTPVQIANVAMSVEELKASV